MVDIIQFICSQFNLFRLSMQTVLFPLTLLYCMLTFPCTSSMFQWSHTNTCCSMCFYGSIRFDTTLWIWDSYIVIYVTSTHWVKKTHTCEKGGSWRGNVTSTNYTTNSMLTSDGQDPASAAADKRGAAFAEEGRSTCPLTGHPPVWSRKAWWARWPPRCCSPRSWWGQSWTPSLWSGWRQVLRK